MDSLMNVKEFTNAFKKNWFIVVGLTVLGLIVGYAGAKYITKPSYTSSTNIVLNIEKKSVKNNFAAALTQNQADAQMYNTYKDMFTQQSIIDSIVDKAQAAGRFTSKYGNLDGAVTVEGNNGSRLFTITAKTGHAQLSADVANGFVQELTAELPSLIKGANTVTVVTKAVPGGLASGSHTKPMAVAGALVGLVLAFYLVIVKELMHPVILALSFFKKRKVAVLGEITDFNAK